MKHTFKIGGIHPAENKTASLEIDLQPLPTTVCLPLQQHIGAPAKAIVKRGDKVTRGQIIADPGGFVSAPVHASISGTVTAIENVIMPDGRTAPAVVIKADEDEHQADTEARKIFWVKIDEERTLEDIIGNLNADKLRAKIAGAGIVGLGGATFPSHVKLNAKDAAPDTLIINGCECEPFLRCDDALMCRWPHQTLEGARLLMRASGVKRVIVGVEDNKPRAIEALVKASEDMPEIEICPVKTKYPQGGEKQLIEALTGRRVASGALPASAGVIVNNIATAFAAYQAIAFDEPLIERIITVTGDIPADMRRNYIVALGTPFSELPFTLPVNAMAIIGGPMMGRSAVRLDAPVTKGSSGLLLLSHPTNYETQPCVRCAECVEACPMGLEPYLISTYGRLRRWDDARNAGVADCIECGSCSYVCPSHRPILDFIRIAKIRSRK